MTVPNPAVQAQGLGAISAEQANTYVQAVANLAQLRSFAGIGQMLVALEGYVSASDGGQGFFYWNATSLGPDNGTTVIVPNNVTQGAWVRLIGAITLPVYLSGVYAGGSPPVGSAFIDGWVLPNGSYSFPPNLVGSYGHVQAGTPPAAPWVGSITHNEVAVGTMTVSTIGAFSFGTTSLTGFTAVGGDRIALIGPASGDGVFNNFFWTFVGTILA